MDRPAHPDRSRPGDVSRAFKGVVGRTVPAGEVSPADVLIDPAHYPSEGDWAFCRFEDPAIPALRVGFQRGGFNIWPDDRPTDPDLLQLHLEVMTADGGLLWLPSGIYPAGQLTSDPRRKDVRLEHDGRSLLSISGWPQMAWHARSEDDELEAHLEVDVRSVTVLPDCLLPHAVFAMWETMGTARGWVRVGASTTQVQGSVFYDHTRVIARDHDVAPRRMYLYTTLALEDGGALFGYQALDDRDHPIEDYCFGVHVDPAGVGTFLPTTAPLDLDLDDDGLPARWVMDWRGDTLGARGTIRVRPLPLLRAWGAPTATVSRARYGIFPLVLDGEIELRAGDGTRRLRATGLAEYFDATAWAGQTG